MSNRENTEVQLAARLLRVLNGISIKEAQDAFTRAGTLLLTTQIVHAGSAPLLVAAETDATFTD
jgi:hypothetical protein